MKKGLTIEYWYYYCSSKRYEESNILWIESTEPDFKKKLNIT